jgi:hypothetical protein
MSSRVSSIVMKQSHWPRPMWFCSQFNYTSIVQNKSEINLTAEGVHLECLTSVLEGRNPWDVGVFQSLLHPGSRQSNTRSMHTV